MPHPFEGVGSDVSAAEAVRLSAYDPAVALAISGTTALDVLLTASIVVPLVILGLVVFFFFRAARREDARDQAVASRAEASRRDR